MKLIFKKGHKSNALRLLGILLGLLALIGMVGYFVNSSTEQTSRVSFPAAAVQYKKQFTEVLSPSDVPIEEKHRKDTSSSTSMRDSKIPDSTNKNSWAAETKQVKHLTNTTLTNAEKQLLVKENMEISSDLQVLSSFDCVKSIPTVLLDYMSAMFLNEYGQSHTDFHSQYKIDETLPMLNQFNISCGIDQNCSTLFQYDKQYGLKTTADSTFKRKEVFYCCPSVHNSRNETISNVCKQAQSVVGKSVFRESKDSTFLGRVIEIIT